MGLVFCGGLWSKEFKGGDGFTGSLDAEHLEKWLQDNPKEDKFRFMVFDNSRQVEKNDKAPDFSIAVSDGQDDNRGGGRGGGRGNYGGRGAPTPRREEPPKDPYEGADQGQTEAPEPAQSPTRSARGSSRTGTPSTTRGSSRGTPASPSKGGRRSSR